MSDKVHITPEEVITQFLKKQNSSNMVVSNFLAIPHIIIEGTNKIFLIIVRSKNGIKFTEDEKRVQAVFLLAGTQDKMLLHFKTLASITTLVSRDKFKKEWIKAENVNSIKNLIILSDRKRY